MAALIDEITATYCDDSDEQAFRDAFAEEDYDSEDPREVLSAILTDYNRARYYADYHKLYKTIYFKLAVLRTILVSY